MQLPTANFPDIYNRLMKTDRVVHEAFRHLKAANPALDPNNDVRITSVAKLGAVISTGCLSLAMANETIARDSWWKQNLPGLKQEESQQFIDNWCNMNRILLFHGSFSAVESSLRAVIGAIAPSTCNGGLAEFKSVYDSLLSTQLSRRYANEIVLLDLMRNVRNTIHNNSVFMPKSGRTESITWEGTTYDFVPRKPVLFVSWNFICDRIEDLLKATLAIMADPVVANFSNRIDDLALSQVPQAVVH